MGSPNKFSPQKNYQDHLFFGQFSLSIDIYVQTYFNIYFVLELASFADTPCYLPKFISRLVQFLCRHAVLSHQFISRLAQFLCWLPCEAVRKKIKTYISEKQNYNSSAAQRINKCTFLSQLSVIDTRNKLVIFFEETYVFIFCYAIPRGQPSQEPPSRLK